MLMEIVTYKGEVLSLSGIGDRKRVAASRAYELGFVLGVNEKGQKVIYDEFAGEMVWPGNTDSHADPADDTAKTEPPKQAPDTVSAQNPDPEQGPKEENPDPPPTEPTPEPDPKPESEKDKVDTGSGISS